MSSRQHLIKRAAEAIEVRLDDLPELHHLVEPLSEVVVDALMPVIAEPRQMKGVPEGSILVVPTLGGGKPLTWQGGLLHGTLKADRMPTEPIWVIEKYGPMTVVWMP